MKNIKRFVILCVVFSGTFSHAAIIDPQLILARTDKHLSKLPFEKSFKVGEKIYFKKSESESEIKTTLSVNENEANILTQIIGAVSYSVEYPTHHTEFTKNQGNTLRAWIRGIDEGTETITLDSLRFIKFPLDGKSLPAMEVKFHVTSPFLGLEIAYFRVILLENKPWPLQMALKEYYVGSPTKNTRTLVHYEEPSIE